MPENESEKIVPCPKCKYIDGLRETCPACKGTGKLRLKKIAKKKDTSLLARLTQAESIDPALTKKMFRKNKIPEGMPLSNPEKDLYQ